MKWVPFHSISRLNTLFVLFCLVIGAIIIRMAILQLWFFDDLTMKAKENWDREIPFMAKRGEIVDRNGVVLVSNELAPTIYFMPAQNPNIEDVAKKLAKYLPLTEEQLVEKLSKKTYLIRIYPEGQNISNEIAKEIAAENIDGVYVTLDYKRAYPYDSMLARLLGFTGADYTGLAGLEYSYDEVLASRANAIRLYTDAKGVPLQHVDSDWRAGVDGATLQLTIDAKLQQIVERELEQAMIEHNADQAWAIAVDPSNGEILALASIPSYDPNDFQQVSPTIYNQNLPVFMTYEPGSTFKIITLAAAVEENLVDLEHDHFYDHGYTLIEGARLRCWKREGHKEQTFLQVVENSCNPGFIELGNRLGNDRLYQYIRDFGFGKSTNSTIAGEATGILFSKEAFGPVEQATTSFGQGISVTPIQQVQAVAAVINGGTLFQPTIVRSVIDPVSNQPLFEQEPVVKKQVINEETSKIVREALESVVANGSGRQAFRDGLRIAGKTGTAQKVENGRYMEGNYIVSFIGFAPAVGPKILVYVAIDHPKSNLQFGGVIAAPLVGNIIEEVAEQYGIEKDLNQLPKRYVWGDALTMRIPNLIGEHKSVVLDLNEPVQIKWHGEGNTIIDQLPKPDEVIEFDDTIHLYLGD